MAHSSDGRADRTRCSSDEDRNINTWLQQQSVQTHLMSINDFLTVAAGSVGPDPLLMHLQSSWSAEEAHLVWTF